MDAVESSSITPSLHLYPTSEGQSEAGERASQASILQKRGPLESIAVFIMRQSYVGTLIIMMVSRSL